MSELKIYKFDDLEFKPHTVLPDGKVAILTFPDGTWVSAVGGRGAYGDGIKTFELWFSDEDEPRGWQSKEDINAEFKKRSFVWLKMF